MRYALISDIHGNLEALDVVMTQIDKMNQNDDTKIDEILCLGDVVGYGPDPDECVEIIKSRSSVCLFGNHDEAGLGDIDLDHFNKVARDAIEWTIHNINDVSKTFLKESKGKYIHEFGSVDNDGLIPYMIVHASPNTPEQWNYILSMEDAATSFDAFSSQVCFVGHSHTPWVIEMNPDGEIYTLQENPSTIKKAHRYLINVGSVGQPRDHNSAAAFGILKIDEDHDKKEYTLIRLKYNINRTQEKIRERGLPDFLADRLAKGQ